MQETQHEKPNHKISVCVECCQSTAFPANMERFEWLFCFTSMFLLSGTIGLWIKSARVCVLCSSCVVECDRWRVHIRVLSDANMNRVIIVYIPCARMCLDENIISIWQCGMSDGLMEYTKFISAYEHITDINIHIKSLGYSVNRPITLHIWTEKGEYYL